MTLEKMDLVMQNWNYKENKSGYSLQILIITYNHKDSIAQTIESVLGQDTKYQYEIIITDDCSTDGTTQICQEYAKKYPDKIRLLTQDKNTYCNFGRSIKKNHIYQALCSLDARYWCYLDGDDCWIDVNKIQIALDFLEQNQEYSIFAHDTLVKTANGSHSFVKDEQKVSEKALKKEIHFSANAPFFMSSSRIQRNIINFKKEKIVFDYLFYYYTLSKGKAYYYDKQMAILHNGDLASNRGAHPIYHSIINKNDFMYLVCHIIDSEDIDKGRIVCQIKIPINYNLDFISNINIIQRLSSSLLEHVIYCYTEYNGDVASIQADIKNNSYKHRLDNDIKNRIQNLSKLSEINNIKNITEA